MIKHAAELSKTSNEPKLIYYIFYNFSNTTFIKLHNNSLVKGERLVITLANLGVERLASNVPRDCAYRTTDNNGR